MILNFQANEKEGYYILQNKFAEKQCTRLSIYTPLEFIQRGELYI